MQRLVISCDVCGITKKEANHWFMARAKPGFFEVFLWEDKAKDDGTLKHVCSESCLTKAMIRTLNGQNVTLPFAFATERASED